ncbi:MAG: sensor domain-containing protein [Acidiferrobacter sp.]
MVTLKPTLAAKFEFLLTLSNDGVFLLDEQAIIVAANPESARLLAQPVATLIGTAFRAWRTDAPIQVLPYDTRPDSLRYEGWFQRGAATFLADVSISTVDHDPPLYVASLRDITDREETRYQNALAMAVFEGSLQGVVVTDAQNAIVAVNPAFERITGYGAKEVQGRDPRFLQSDRHDKAFYAAMWEAIRTDGCWQGEIWDRRKDGSVYPEWLTISVIRNADGAVTHHVAIFADITERKRYERRLLHLTELYGVLSRVNQLIARRPDPDTLYADICRVAVQFGGLCLAWIGLVDDNGRQLRIVAGYGAAYEQARALKIPLTFDDPAAQTVAASAIKDGTLVVENNYTHSDRPQPWRTTVASFGAESVAAFPIRRAGRISGVLTVYAAERGFFDDELTHLLQRITGDIAFALDSADKETRRMAAETRAHYLARHDILTGLYRRNVLEEALVHAHASSQTTGKPYSVALVDLDHFKMVNDSYGHAVGDRVLIDVAEILRQTFRLGDLVGRWGGEEFLCLLPGLNAEGALGVAERVRQQIAQTVIMADDRKLQITASIGVGSYPGEGTQIADILVQADTALYQAKQQGGNQVAQAGEAPGIFWIGGQIEEALRTSQIVAAYQPIVVLASGQRVADEALARLVRPDHSVMTATDFIEAASHLGQLYRIDQAVIAQVMDRCVAELNTGHVPMLHFFNASAGLLSQTPYLTALLDKARCYERTRGPGQGFQVPLVIEITERAILRNPQAVSRDLQPLIDFGFRIALDDFGSGYSSLLYLAQFPISFLKIEQKLVAQVRTDRRVAMIVRSVAALAHDLGLTTIAEGIEDEASQAMLRELGIDWGQGYHFGSPEVPRIVASA